MESRKILIILFLALGVIVCSAKVSKAQPEEPMGDAFTYQGHLYDNNDVANGLYDFQFKLYLIYFGEPHQIGDDVNMPDVDVIDSYFTVVLDFNNPIGFNGFKRFLEIGVRPGDMNDPNEYTFLEPLQELTPTPYASYANTAGRDNDWMVSGIDMNSIPSGNVGIGTSPGDKLDVDGHINSSESYKLDGETVLSNTGTGNIFVGAHAGANNTGGFFNSAMGNYALYLNTDGHSNTAIGHEALEFNTTGNFNSAIGSAALYSNTEGFSNSAMGYGALYYNTDGHSNTAIGNGALHSNTTGYYNSAIGLGALEHNTESPGNSAMGYRALYSNTTGHSNSAVGSGALENNTEGILNTAMGNSALRLNSTGHYNSAMGNMALYSNTEGHRNSAVGVDALRYNTGERNSAMGMKALSSNTTGERNTAMGVEALSSNTTGERNTAMGAQALYFTTDANNNTAVGYRAGFSNITGSGNVFLGYWAGYDETGSNKLYIANSDADPPLIYGEFDTGNVGIGTSSPGSKLDVDGFVNSSESYKLDGDAVLSNTGTDNIFAGKGAGASITTGQSNSAMGFEALYNNTEGGENSAMGRRVLFSNTTGHSNSAMGRSALFCNTKGSWNSAMGQQTLYNNTEGSYNTATGNDALFSNTTSSRNTAMGYAALQNTDANDNTAVGHRAGGSNINGSGNVFLGYRAGYYETGSNKLYIANSSDDPPLIYGEFDTGNVGIGTTSPSYPLEMGSGAHCTVGGVWTNASSARLKENFSQVDGRKTLAKLLQLPITRWNYKAEDASIQHIGPVAEDFHVLFGLGDSDKTISAIDPSGVAIAAIKGLHELVQERDVEIAELKERLSKLESLMAKFAREQEGGV